uniref:Uncharacterized protein n=1 Tax=Anguilla anguilla TaxID=7936 RepID=A0A0E9XTI3_ANGAN
MVTCFSIFCLTHAVRVLMEDY